MGESHLIRLPFLERRTYIHGTSLFDALVAATGARIDIEYKIRRKLESNSIAIDRLSTQDPVSGYAASFRAMRDGQLEIYGAKDAAAADPSPRLEARYDERSVADAAERLTDGVRFSKPWPYSFVSVLVPLHKALLVASGLGDGPWLFTGLRLTEIPEANAPIEMRIGKLLSRGQLVSSDIHVAGGSIGAIEFVRQPKSR